MFRLKVTNAWISKLTSWLIALCCFSYPITIVLILQLGLNPGPINIILKSSYASLSLFIIIVAIYKTGRRMHLSVMPLLLFFVLYAFRLVFDVSFRGIEMLAYNSAYIYSYYFGATLLPCFAIIATRKFIDIYYLLRILFLFLVMGNILLLFNMVTQGEQSFVNMLSGRAQIIDIEKGSSFTFINPITLGVSGALMIIFIVANIITKAITTPKGTGFLILIGIANILIGASRGPLLSLILVLLVLFLFYFKQAKKGLKWMVKLFFALVVACFAIYLLVTPLLIKYDIFLVQRIFMFYDKIEHKEKEYRDYAFEAAFNDFKDSPILGKQFVGTYDNFYPHNLTLEILMALGLVGGILYVAFNFQFINSSYIIWKRPDQKDKFVLLALSGLYTLQSFTSGTIIANPEYWVLLTLAILLPYIPCKTTTKSLAENAE